MSAPVFYVGKKMLNKTMVDDLKSALEVLGQPHESTGMWPALKELSRLSEHDCNFTIDLGASTKIGTPVIIAQMQPSSPDLIKTLSPRQREVARLILKGYSNKAIANALTIQTSTVKDHVHCILTTLGFSTRQQFTAAALTRHFNGQY